MARSTRLFKEIFYCILTLLSFASLSPATFADAKVPAVVATTGMVADMVKNIGGDVVSVSSLMGPGIDPHLYKPTRSDMVKLTGADVVFYNGLLLEGRMTDALLRVASGGRPVFAVTETFDPAFLLEPPEFQGHFDPHVWMDPRGWAAGIDVVVEKLSKQFPANAETFKKNGAQYRAALEALDRYSEEMLHSVPKGARVLVTAHDAFNYFGRRYEFEVVGIQGISTESEAGVRDIERIVKLLVDRSIAAVFIESTVSERNVQALLEGARSAGHTVRIGGQLFSDAMGTSGTYEGTYIGMIDHNVTTITRALGGKAPPGGMQGKLALTPEAKIVK
jgi:manganese/zinc/iron transport system substrate-binding protein